MRPRSLLVLALLVAALAGFAWFVDRDRAGSDERRGATDLAIELDTASVVELRVEHGAEVARLTRELDSRTEAAGIWWLESPSAHAKGDIAEGLLRALASLTVSRELPATELAPLGLEPALVTIGWTESDGDRGRLRVGDVVPASGERFARLGERLITVRGDFLESLPAQASGWRSERAWRLRPSPGERLELLVQSDAGNTRLVREAGQWNLRAPIDDRADAERAAQWFERLAALTAARFIDSSEYALSELPTASVVWTPPSGDPERLGIRCTSSQPICLFERSDGQHFAAPWPGASELASLTGAPQSWRSRAWTTLVSGEVSRLELLWRRTAASSLVFDRRAGDWVSETGERLSFEPIEALLGGVSDLRAQSVRASLPEVAEDSAAAREPAAVELTLGTSDGVEEMLSLWPASGRVRSSLRTVGLQLSAADVETLMILVAAVTASADGSPTE